MLVHQRVEILLSAMSQEIFARRDIFWLEQSAPGGFAMSCQVSGQLWSLVLELDKPGSLQCQIGPRLEAYRDIYTYTYTYTYIYMYVCICI